MRRRAWGAGVAALAVLAGAALVQARDTSPPWDGPVVPAWSETASAYGERDTADDPAIWIHPGDPELSLVLGTNKGSPGGLQVFDLAGAERQFLRVGRLNNVDVREGFPFADGSGALVAATNRTDDALALFRVRRETRTVEEIGSLPTGLPEVYGFCLHRSPRTGRFYAFVTTTRGTVAQYELAPEGARVQMRLRQTWQLESEAEGCAVDDEHETLYLTEEQRGLWKVATDPDSPQPMELLEGTVDDGTGRRPLVADVEGVAVYDAGGGDGYVVVSSQGNSTLAVYRRIAPHQYLGSFAVAAGGRVDGATSTDGVEVTSAPLGERFPAGLLVVHDQQNRQGPTSNFKYVSWADVSRVLALETAASR